MTPGLTATDWNILSQTGCRRNSFPSGQNFNSLLEPDPVALRTHAAFHYAPLTIFIGVGRHRVCAALKVN